MENLASLGTELSLPSFIGWLRHKIKIPVWRHTTQALGGSVWAILIYVISHTFKVWVVDKP